MNTMLTRGQESQKSGKYRYPFTPSGKDHMDLLSKKLKRANGMLSKVRHYVLQRSSLKPCVSRRPMSLPYKRVLCHYYHHNHHNLSLLSQSVTFIITTTTICHYYRNLSLLSSQPPPICRYIITTTTTYNYHHNHHNLSLLSSQPPTQCLSLLFRMWVIIDPV
jgi:hypothetical protein